jgi:hypothetical protein
MSKKQGWLSRNNVNLINLEIFYELSDSERPGKKAVIFIF